MASEGGNGDGRWDDIPRGRECGDCEWAAMTHQNHVRLLQLERREGEWVSEQRATRNAIIEYRQTIAGELASLANNVNAIVGDARADVQSLRIDLTEGIAALSARIDTLTTLLKRLTGD